MKSFRTKYIKLQFLLEVKGLNANSETQNEKSKSRDDSERINANSEKPSRTNSLIVSLRLLKTQNRNMIYGYCHRMKINPFQFKII